MALRLTCKVPLVMLITKICGDPRHSAALGSSSAATASMVVRRPDAIFLREDIRFRYTFMASCSSRSAAPETLLTLFCLIQLS